MSKKNTIKKKLRSIQGETMIETLIGVMISCLAMAALVTCITTATNLIRDSKINMAAYYDANNHVAAQDGTADAAGTLVIRDAENHNQELIEGHEKYDVEYYVNQKKNVVVSFRKVEADESTERE